MSAADQVPVVHGSPMILVVTAVVLVATAGWSCLEQHVPVWAEERRLARLARATRAAYDAGAHLQLLEVDHVDCAADDCDAVICRCRKPAECSRATTLGCDHEGLCWDCRLGCGECAFEAHTEQALAWAAGR